MIIVRLKKWTDNWLLTWSRTMSKNLLGRQWTVTKTQEYTWPIRPETVVVALFPLLHRLWLHFESEYLFKNNFDKKTLFGSRVASG